MILQLFLCSFFFLITVILSLQCGSCWAFSVVGAMQSVHAIDGSQLAQLSVQQVLDCSFQNEGCNGGSPLRALNWLKQVCSLLFHIFRSGRKIKLNCQYFMHKRCS